MCLSASRYPQVVPFKKNRSNKKNKEKLFPFQESFKQKINQKKITNLFEFDHTPNLLILFCKVIVMGRTFKKQTPAKLPKLELCHLGRSSTIFCDLLGTIGIPGTPKLTASSPLKIGASEKERIVFQPSILRGELLVSGRVSHSSLAP